MSTFLGKYILAESELHIQFTAKLCIGPVCKYLGCVIWHCILYKLYMFFFSYNYHQQKLLVLVEAVMCDCVYTIMSSTRYMLFSLI